MSMIAVQNATNSGRRERKSKDACNLNKYEDWTYEEKCQLLQALKKYGHSDMKNLCKSVPTKSKRKIYLFIKILWNIANKTTGFKKNHRSKREENAELEKVPVIDKWLHLLQSAQPKQKYNEIKSLPIAKAFFFISKHEKHPDPAHCNGIDFRALYEILYSMLCGHPLRNINASTHQFMLKSFKEIQQEIKQLDLQQRMQFLNELKCINYADSYSSNVVSDMEDAGECLTALSCIQGYNPLAIPMNLLKL